ncbi:NAD(P)H-binding protein [Corynebacterium caspium]|uniref:NAD(P)H-binding protein n=1 Tax=Corynebacterium caspium TaxID=234828 RepID=UPI0014617061|nr:NAD(P)H-binding protein [Corynebacterium caspium]
MSSSNESRNILILGGSGKIARLATKMLIDAGHQVTSVIRDAAAAPELEALGAQVEVCDITQAKAVQWNKLQGDKDIVVWAAGLSKTSDATDAADAADAAAAVRTLQRDAPWSMIDSLNRFDDRPSGAPLLIMLSYTGSLNNPWPKGDPKYAYGLAKQEVDRRLEAGVKFPFVVIAAGEIVDEATAGFESVADNAAAAGPTSRKLLAELIVEIANRGKAAVPEEGIRLPLKNGTQPVASLGYPVN